MRKIWMLLALVFAMPAVAAETAASAYVAEFVNPAVLKKGEAQTLTFTLRDAQTQKPFAWNALKVEHTKKIHALIADPALEDYQHLHPEKTAAPGQYQFRFTPTTNRSYRVWFDVTPANGAHAYVMADLKGEASAPKLRKKESHEANVDGYRFVLSLEGAPKAGEAVMAQIAVTDASGKPVTQLQPVLGAFAHMVGIFDDYETVAHVHPMGEEPKNDAARAASPLMFHIEPKRAGFLKLFAQVRMSGQDIFVPFGIFVR